jgi:plasmid maintenance system antidote protein VapI
MTRLEIMIKERGIKKGWVAEKAGIAPGTFSRIVKGDQIPTLPVALRIAEVMDTTVEFLWGHLK